MKLDRTKEEQGGHNRLRSLGGNFLTPTRLKQLMNNEVEKGGHFRLTSELKQIRGINKGAGLTNTKLKQTEGYTEPQYRYGDRSKEQGGHFLITIKRTQRKLYRKT